jgi:hypothetical protein
MDKPGSTCFKIGDLFQWTADEKRKEVPARAGSVVNEVGLVPGKL